MKSTIACLLGLIAVLFGTCTASKLYRYDEGDFTMLEQMDLALEIPYVKTDKTVGSVKLTVENASVYNDGCSLNDTYAVLQLQFGEYHVHNLTQTFKSDGKVFSMESISFGILLDSEVFKDAKDQSKTFILNGADLFETSVENSYACNADVNEHIGEPTKPSQLLNMTFSNMQLQPFGVKDAKFSAGEHCAADKGTTTAPPTTVGTTGSSTTMGTMGSSTTMGTMGSSTTMGTMESSTTTGITETGTTQLSTTTKAPAPEHHNNTLNKLNVTSDKAGKLNCIMEQIEAVFVVKQKKVEMVFNMSDAVVDPARSDCGNRTENKSAVLFATFGDLNASTLRQEFAVNGDKYYYLKRITLNLIVPNMNEGANLTFDVNMTKDNSTFQVQFGKSLKCDTNTTIDGKTKSKDHNVTMYFSKMRLQAFDIKKSEYSTASECAADHAISNIVPIAVGCALAVLVIIVLVAYLIGRRNSSRAGYESV